MARDALVRHVGDIFRSHGAGDLTFAALKAAGIYFHLHKKGIRHSDLVREIGATAAYEAYKAQHFVYETPARVKRRWTWDRVLREARAVTNAEGHLPPAQWFQANGKGALVAAVYGAGRTWVSLREALDSFATSDFVASRNGMRWRSHPEASVSNFLYARGIAHKVGCRYPSAVAEQTPLARAFYDLHFEGAKGVWVDVEIWGDKPNGHDADAYARRRAAKESFNEANPNFIGIHYLDCFDEERLGLILSPYLGGLVAPTVFEKPADKLIPSTHWSNADELLDYCRSFAEQQPDKIFPSEGWLRKRGRYKNRPGEPYNTLAIYITQWIGGVRRLRTILGQGSKSTTLWNESVAIEHYRDFWREHGFTPSQAKAGSRRGSLSRETLLRAQNICRAVEVYAGGVKVVNNLLGLSHRPKRKWSKEKLSTAALALHTRYGLLPSQIMSASPDFVRVFAITDADRELARRMAAAIPEHFGTAREFYAQLGVQPRDIRTVAKARQRHAVSTLKSEDSIQP